MSAAAPADKRVQTHSRVHAPMRLAAPAVSSCKKQTIACYVLRRLSAWIIEHPWYLGAAFLICSLFFFLPLPFRVSLFYCLGISFFIFLIFSFFPSRRPALICLRHLDTPTLGYLAYRFYANVYAFQHARTQSYN